MKIQKPKFMENYSDWMKRNNIQQAEWFEIYRSSSLKRHFCLTMAFFITGIAYRYYILR